MALIKCEICDHEEVPTDKLQICTECQSEFGPCCSSSEPQVCSKCIVDLADDDDDECDDDDLEDDEFDDEEDDDDPDLDEDEDDPDSDDDEEFDDEEDDDLDLDEEEDDNAVIIRPTKAVAV